MGTGVAGEVGFLCLKLFQVFLSEFQVLFGLLAFNPQLVNRLFAYHVITSFLFSEHTKSSRLFTVESF